MQEFLGTSSLLNIKVAINAVDIMASDLLEWFVLPVLEKKGIYSTSYDYMFLFYECLIIRIWLCLPFFEFEQAVFKHLKIVPSGRGHMWSSSNYVLSTSRGIFYDMDVYYDELW